MTLLISLYLYCIGEILDELLFCPLFQTTELLDLDTRLTNMEQPDHKREFGQQQSIKLPPSSPYDKFLKAAGC